MAINQPPITGDNILDAWMLEVTRELNSGVSRSGVDENAVRRISVITNNSAVEDCALRSNRDQDIPDSKISDDIARDSEVAVKSVDTNGILDLSDAGELSISSAELNANLQAINIFATITQEMVDNDLRIITYDALTEVFDTHFLFLGGMKLIEGVEYDTHRQDDTLQPNQIRFLNPLIDSLVGLRLEISNWSV